MLKEVLKLFSQKVKAGILILIGSLFWSLTMVKSGLIYPFGMGFWGANGHDGVWHLALINSIGRGSREMPVFAGSALKNYHIGFDLLLVLINKLTNLPINFLYFQIFPPVAAILVGILTYKFVFLWKRSTRYSLFAIFFVYFGGSFGWIITLLRGQGVGGESMFWSQQAISSLINPSFALSLVFILLGLIFLLKYQKSFSIWHLAFSILCFGILIEIKVYAGLLVLGGLLLSSLLRALKAKKFDIFLIFLGSLIISLILFVPSFGSSSKLLVFRPFWFLETMMGLSDRLGWQKFYSAMINYRAGGLWLKAVIAYIAAFAIFLIGNLGTRIIGFWQLKNLKKFTWMEIFAFTVIGGGIIIPMFFLQAGTPWNTIQFFYYSLFFSSILAGITLGSIRQNQLFIILIFLLTVPTTIGTLYYVYLPSRPPAMVSNEELQALNVLSKQPFGVVLTYPYDPVLAKEAEANPPRPLYLYESTAYVSAFSNKPVFLEDQVNLDITGYDWRGRRAKIEEFYQTLDQAAARDFLKTNKIIYLYWVKGQRAKLGEGQLGLTRIFENSKVDIWKVE